MSKRFNLVSLDSHFAISVVLCGAYFECLKYACFYYIVVIKFVGATGAEPDSSNIVYSNRRSLGSGARGPSPSAKF